MKLLKIIAILGVIIAAFTMLRVSFHTSQGGKRMISGENVKHLPKDFKLTFKLDSGATAEVTYPPFITQTTSGRTENLAERPEVIHISHTTWFWNIPKYNDAIFNEAQHKADQHLIPYGLEAR